MANNLIWFLAGIVAGFSLTMWSIHRVLMFLKDTINEDLSSLNSKDNDLTRGDR